MVRSELYSNLKNTVKLLHNTLLPEGSKEVSKQNSEEEMELLQYEIGNLNYSYLDEIYNTGLDGVVNEKLSPVENVLISSVGLLDEYGLSNEEFKEWMEKQDEIYRPLLGMLTGAKIADGELEKLKFLFAEKSRKRLFDSEKIDVSPKNGMRFAEDQAGNGSRNFYYLQKVLIFDKEFNDYNRAVYELESAFKDALEEYKKKQAGTLRLQGACGEHFYETLLALAQAFKEAQDNILRTMTGKLRGWKVEPDAIQKFRWKYKELTQDACANFIHLFEHMVEVYDQCYPQKEAYRHEYIDYISVLRAGRRDVDIALSDYSSVEKDALHVANQVATSAANQFAGSFMDALRASNEQIAFTTKLKKVFESDEYKEAIDEIFYEFEDAVGMEYAEVLEIKVYGQDGAQLEENVCEKLGEEVRANRMNRSMAAEFLKTYTLRCPYDAKIYATAYFCFGGGAGDVEGITKYLGIYEQFVDHIKEACVPELKNQMNLTMQGDDLEQLEADVQVAKRIVRKYALLQKELKPYVSKMQSELEAKKYTATHPKEETLFFYKVLDDKELTKDAIGLCLKRSKKRFAELYSTYAARIDQSTYGPISAFYEDTIIFTPEKLFYCDCDTPEKKMTAIDYDELQLSYYTMARINDRDRRHGNYCKIGDYDFEFDGDGNFLKILKFWAATKKVKKLLAELPENEMWDISALENNETAVRILQLLKEDFDLNPYGETINTREFEQNTENSSSMNLYYYDLKSSPVDYFTDQEISTLLKMAAPLTGTLLKEVLMAPKERAAKKEKAEAERRAFMDFWSEKPLEARLQDPNPKVSMLAKIACYCYKDPVDAAEGQENCRNIYIASSEPDTALAKKKIDLIFEWAQEHPVDFEWTDAMEQANCYIEDLVYGGKVLSVINKKNSSFKDQLNEIRQLAIRYRAIDDENEIVTIYEPKIAFTMPLLANLELKCVFGSIPDALECDSYESAVKNRKSFFEIVTKYHLGKVDGEHCELNRFYEEEFNEKGSFAFYIKWLNDEFPIEIEYQKKMQSAKGIKKILLAASRPRHIPD